MLESDGKAAALGVLETQAEGHSWAAGEQVQAAEAPRAVARCCHRGMAHHCHRGTVRCHREGLWVAPEHQDGSSGWWKTRVVFWLFL